MCLFLPTRYLVALCERLSHCSSDFINHKHSLAPNISVIINVIIFYIYLCKLISTLYQHNQGWNSKTIILSTDLFINNVFGQKTLVLFTFIREVASSHPSSEGRWMDSLALFWCPFGSFRSQIDCCRNSYHNLLNK